MAGTTGTLRRVTLDGTTFRARGDTNIKRMGSQFTNEAIPTTGENLRKMTKRVDTAESVDLAVTGAELELLKALSERTDDFPMSYETAGGDVYRTVGWIDLESQETEESKASIKMFPRGKWEAFLAA